jgi:hypothetical protein
VNDKQQNLEQQKDNLDSLVSFLFDVRSRNHPAPVII